VFEFDLIPEAIPGRDLPADTARSGSFVLRFGGVSLGKSGISSGRTGARGRGPGELGRDDGAEEGISCDRTGARGRGPGELGRDDGADEGISCDRTGARGRGPGELGRDDGADDGAELRPLLAADLFIDVVKLLLLEFLPKEGKRPRAGADGRAAGWRVGVDDRELERLIEGTVPEDSEVALLAP
jgi:hypothetical protein